MGSIIEDIVDIIEDVIDPIVEIIEDIGDFLFGWLIPDMPDLPDFEAMLHGDGIMVNKRNSDASLPVIYGTRRVGGNIVWLAVSPDNQFLYVVLALCEGQVARMTELYLDDELYATYSGSDGTFGNPNQVVSSLNVGSPTSAPTNTSGLSIETDHKMYKAVEVIDETDTDIFPTNFIFFDGHDAGFDSSINFGTSSLGWTSAHLGKGICHAMFSFKYNADAFGKIPKINFTIRGKQINTNLSGSSYAYSANPALVLYDYLTSTRYGKGLSASDINTTAFTTAAGVCDTNVTPYTGASTEKLFECHTALGNKTKIIDNVKKVLSSMRAFFTFSGGLYTIKIEGTGSSVLSITEDMIIGSVNVIGESKQKKYNRVIARFDNAEKNFQPDEVIYPPKDETNVGADFKYATMLANDNDEELHFEMSMPCTVSPYQAEDMAELVLKRSRAGLQIAFNATSEAQELAIGDIFHITHSGFGFSAKNYICMGITLQNNGSVGIKGLQYSADAYTYNTKLQTASQPTTFLPNPKIVQAPILTSITDTAVNVTEGNLNVIMTVSFRGTSDFFVDKFEVVYKKSTDSIYKSAGISSNQVREIPVESETTYNVKVRSINTLGYKSAYVAGDHYVVGFADPPADVTNFAIDYQDQTAVLSWTPSTDLDLAYYHIRFSPDTTHSYPNTTVLVEKVSTPANSVIVPAKAGIYYIKAFDLLGHESTTATGVIGTLSEFQGQVLATTITEETGFSGSHSGTVGIDNILKLDSNGNFDSASGNFDDAVGSFDQGSGVISTGTYTFANQISLGAKYQGRVSSFLNVDYLDYINNFDSMAGNFDSVAGLFDSGASTVDYDAKLFIATSDDNSTFTAFRPFQDGNYAFRYAKFQIILTSNVSSATPQVNNCQVKLFMTDRTEKEQNVASTTSSSGKAITFSNAFFTEPSVTIASQNLATGDFFTITSKSATGFTIEYFNSSGSTINRTFDYIATGQGRAI